MKVWNLNADLKPIVLQGHAEMAISVAFSADGKKFASVGQDNTAIIWDAATREPLLKVKSKTKELFGVAFSLEGNTLVTTSRDGVQEWEVSTGRELQPLGAPSSVIMALSPNGKTFVFSGDNNGKVILADVASKQEMASFEKCWRPVFSSDGKKLALSCADMATRMTNIKIVEVATGKMLQSLKTPAPAWMIAFSPDCKSLAAVTLIGNNPDNKVRLWDLLTGQEVMIFSGHGDGVGAVTFSPDGRRLATAGLDKTIKLWDTTTGDDLLTLRGHDQMVTSVAFSPDGQTLASTSVDKTIRLWRAATAAEVQARRGQ